MTVGSWKSARLYGLELYRQVWPGRSFKQSAMDPVLTNEAVQ